ncbi:carboxypeptidase regulatory-like domain-containing protein [Pedobacter sp. MR2016-19]|uniref:carboxypeptidase-like regulatory domain-containing protein n=1 Tax=Pedobacter sp. MR2016-19 TaxID=2780089 RepID=UPI0018735654|nr:carboxypeptidase-like regulatory domain-containing protein [Pedobacter sp. MR2016-19]MBE5319581.1 carboxypeptidase regulatory-like domain-containing protein [Pedobacter sp. MR2016-19]
MKERAIIAAFLLCISFTIQAQVKRISTSTERKETNTQSLRNQAPEGHYCDYCKLNYPESHFPCIMKAIKGKLDVTTGEVSFVAGQPIGGIVVKAGKNPGGNTITLVTNQNGEIEFNNASIGNYKFIISVPSTNPKSRVAGSPIGGIIVKGGKNPGGSLITLMTNENGEIELNDLPAGLFKFTILGASETEKSNPLYKSSYLKR